MHKKREISQNLPNYQVEEETSFIIMEEPKPLEIGSACSFSLEYDNGGTPLIRVKTYGNVDITKLRQMILERYPEAKLRISETPKIEVHKPAKPKRKRKRLKGRNRKI